MARRMDANSTWLHWTASSAVKEANQDGLNANLRFAESLGAQVVRLKARKRGDSVAEFVRSKTYHPGDFGRVRFTIGASIYTYRQFTASCVNRPAVDVHIVTQESEE